MEAAQKRDAVTAGIQGAEGATFFKKKLPDALDDSRMAYK